MKFASTFVGILAAGFLLAACETPPTDTANVKGTGSMATGGAGAPVDTGAMGNESSGGMGWLAPGVGDRVFFDYDQSSIHSDGESTLRSQAEWLKKNPNISVTVEGHCDERGTREYNLALGERRAASAKRFLVSQGVSASRISTISYGKERPAVVGSNEEAWAQNRRAVTVVVNQ